MAVAAPLSHEEEGFLVSLYTSEEFRARIIGECGLTRRQTFGLPIVQNSGRLRSDLQNNVELSIKLGYYRARMYRFLRDRGFDPNTWLPAQRAQADTLCKNSRDRSADETLVTRRFPEFETWTPDSSLGTDEVVLATKQEVHDLMLSPGSDHHHMRLCQVHKFTIGTTGTPATKHNSQTLGDAATLRSGTVRVTEGTTSAPQFESIDFDNAIYQGLEPQTTTDAFIRNGEVFGPVITRIACHFVKVFGLVPTTYWIWSRLFYSETPELLRVLGGLDLAPRAAEGSSLRKDVERKLKQMDEELVNLRGDLHLNLAYETMLEAA